MESAAHESATTARPIGTRLNLFDATCLIVGIIVGAAIYETPTDVAGAVDYSWQLYALWMLGGVISLAGAVCYAELATTYPESGGDVVYLSKAYGDWAGFLFGWLQTFVARPGDISLMAFVFARYVHVLVGTGNEVPIWPAVAVVLLLTAINIVGLRSGKTMQNVLTVGKILGLLFIIGVAFVSTPTVTAAAGSEVVENQGFRLSKGVALVLILFTYGGWNEMVYVASEVENPKRNIWKALIFGTLAVMVCYLLTNAAFLHVLTLPGLAASEAVATDSVARALPRNGVLLVAAVIAISSAGAINGLVLTGARITGALRKFEPFGWLGARTNHSATPVRALVLQGAIAVTVICIARSFDVALIYTSAAVYTFYLATNLSVVVLRRKHPDVERPFRIPFYPLPPVVFGVGCVWAIYSAITYKPQAARICFCVLLVGSAVYWIGRFRKATSLSS